MEFRDPKQWDAWCRMSAYDNLPAAKRMFIQQNDHLFTKGDLEKHKVSVLIKHRKHQSAAWYRINYGKDHPFALQIKPRVKRERSSQ